MHMQDAQAYNYTLQYPPGGQTLLIFKQELNYTPQSSPVNQTPCSFCSPKKSVLIQHHNKQNKVTQVVHYWVYFKPKKSNMEGEGAEYIMKCKPGHKRGTGRENKTRENRRCISN